MANYSGLFGNIPTAALMGQPQAPEPPAKHGGFFGSGGAGRNILGNIGDVLLQFGGMQPIYGPQMERQQALAQQQQLMAARQAADWQEFQKEYNYKLANPAPSDDAFTRALSMAGVDLNSEQGKQLALQRAQALAADPNDAFVATSLPGDRFYAGPKSGLAAALGGITGGAPAGVQEGATATNPQTGQKLIFRGGQWQPMGGTGGNVSGGFPQ